MSIISEVILVGGSFLCDFLIKAGSAKTALQKNSDVTLVIKIKFARFMKKFFTITVLFLGFALFSSKAFAHNSQQFNHDPKNYNVKLQIFDNDKKTTEFLVAIANNSDTREYGLMNLDKLDQKHGMIFIFDSNLVVNMWMKNTLIPLDMIFIDENNIIVNIKEDTKPLSLEIISSQKIVKKVLEINAGLSKKLGIKNGQKIIYENF